MTRITRILAALLWCPLASLGAQDAMPVRGVGVGGDLVALVMRTTSGSGARDTPTGVGLRIQLSYGFNERLGVFAGAQTVSVRTGGAEELTQYEAGARVTFLGVDSPVRPYFEGSVVAREIVTRMAVINGQPTPLRARGGAVQVAGGVHLFEFHRVSFDLAIAVTNGSFRNPPALDDRLTLLRGNVPSTALRGGLRYFPGWLGFDE